MKRTFFAPEIKVVGLVDNLCDHIILVSGGNTGEQGIVEADAKGNGSFFDDDDLPQAKSVWDD